MAKIVKNNSGIRGVKFFIFLIVASWTFFGWPGIKQAQAAAPSVISKGTASAGTGTSVTPGYPASPQTNDIIFILAISNQPVSIGVINTPSGFTEAAQGTYQNSTPANRGRAALFWKRAAGGESGTVSVSRTGDTGTDGVFFAQMYLVRGAETTGNPWDAVTARYGPGNATVTWDAVTVSGAERTLLALVAQADNASTVDPPTGYSALATDTTASGTDAEVRICYKENVSSDGSVTGTGGETEGWATFHVSVKPVPVTLSISVSPLTWGVGTVDAATTQMSTSGNKINVTNDGNVAETFTLQIYDEDDRNEWTHSSLKTGAGNNIYVLSGIFCATADSPVQASFNETDSEDVLTTAQQTATSTKFAYAGGSANAVAVPVSGQRSLWLRLDMPTAVSGTYAYDQHTVTVRISCQQS